MCKTNITMSANFKAKNPTEISGNQRDDHKRTGLSHLGLGVRVGLTINQQPHTVGVTIASGPDKRRKANLLSLAYKNTRIIYQRGSDVNIAQNTAKAGSQITQIALDIMLKPVKSEQRVVIINSKLL